MPLHYVRTRRYGIDFPARNEHGRIWRGRRQPALVAHHVVSEGPTPTSPTSGLDIPATEDHAHA
eukprot:COSAG01_NODE_33106_length_570_cov_0.821656_1_plen_63_part_01